MLWAAGRVLIGQKAAEAEGLIQQVAQGLGYVSMNMTDPDIKTKWFSVASHRELAGMVGFEFSEGFGPVTSDVELDARELEVLRDLTSGSGDDAARPDEISQLLGKLEVESETEAIEYAIRAGVTWQ